mmetsp:Transcript_5848/g.9071  ORF Transcript_5848/g.9071 Transcript_5848/m.9071 type:complete len:598 (+) Transcript_5848:47-1840(+)
MSLAWACIMDMDAVVVVKSCISCVHNYKMSLLVAIISVVLIGVATLWTSDKCASDDLYACFYLYTPSDVNFSANPPARMPKPVQPAPEYCYWDGPFHGLITGDMGAAFGELEPALEACKQHEECAGVTFVARVPLDQGGGFRLRKGSSVEVSSDGELSYTFVCKTINVDPNVEFQLGKGQVAGDEPFFEPNGDSNEVGYDINEMDSILISIASYRDRLCLETINDAIRRAEYPERLVFAIVDQRLAHDKSCFPSKADCESLSKDEVGQILPVCQYMDQVRITHVDARHAKGPTHGRHLADRLYRGETFVLQIDSHMVFVQDWDTAMISQWESLSDDDGILTSYPTTVGGAIDMTTGKSRLNSTPVMCLASEMEDTGLLRFSAAVEVQHEITRKPLQQPFWAAGLSFARGHRVLRVPYDCCTPMLFMGEEFHMSSRLFTHGYSFYSFQESLVFHYYPEERPKENLPMFWENMHLGTADKGGELRSAHRVRHILGFTVQPEVEFDRSHLEVYKLGETRDVRDYFEIIGLQFDHGGEKVVGEYDLCGSVLSRDFTFDPDWEGDVDTEEAPQNSEDSHDSVEPGDDQVDQSIHFEDGQSEA